MNKVEFSRTAKVPFAKRYDNYIGGKWVAPSSGQYFENISPVNGRPLGEIARGNAADIELALDAAHKAKDAWGRTSPAARALILNRIADRMEDNLDLLALAETWDNGKPIRETTAADLPLALRKAACRKSTMTPLPIISMSRWASSARSFPGISRC